MRIFAVGLLALFCCLATRSGLAANYVPNGSFECGDGVVHCGWGNIDDWQRLCEVVAWNSKFAGDPSTTDCKVTSPAGGANSGDPVSDPHAGDRYA